ncbi:MAG: hypothetical protein GXO42_01880 [bacterium]|nr:hypothetical protein [bacterium]
MYIIIPDRLYALIEKYAEKYGYEIKDVVISALISYLATDPELARDLLERSFDAPRRYLTQKEKELLLKVLRVPREERTEENLKRLLGEQNFRALVRKALLVVRDYSGKKVYEVPYFIYKRLEAEIEKEEEEEKPVQKKEFVLYKQDAGEKLVSEPGTPVPERAQLDPVLVQRAMELLRGEFPGEFSLQQALEFLQAKLGLESKEAELVLRAAIAQLYLNGELYNPKPNIFAWV